MAKILFTLGPIPAKLDSVKYLTNRFKGGLAWKTAIELCKEHGHEVTVVKWKYHDVPDGSDISIINVEDIYDYRDTVLKTKADVYVLAAAVANLMPSNPWKGKFASHNYKIGDRFNIEFEIAPRIIDLVKKEYPRSALVGYKLYDGTDEQLIEAGWETLINSKANIVFANHPAWAKERKIMLTSDGSEIYTSFDEHIKWIDKLANSKYYITQAQEKVDLERPHKTWFDLSTGITQKEHEEINAIAGMYPKFQKRGMTFGCFAYRLDNGQFITTSRGKKESGFSRVISVDHEKRIIEVKNTKATLNAPLLDNVFKNNPQYKILIHSHKNIEGFLHLPYELPGTDREVEIAKNIHFELSVGFNIQNHGYIAGFKTFEGFKHFLQIYK